MIMNTSNGQSSPVNTHLTVLTCQYPPDDGEEKLDNYVQCQDKLDFTGIPFPFTIGDIPKFEKLREDFNKNILYFRDIVPKGGSRACG